MVSGFGRIRENVGTKEKDCVLLEEMLNEYGVDWTDLERVCSVRDG